MPVRDTCLKPIDEEETILCARLKGHATHDANGNDLYNFGCCPHEESKGAGKTPGGRLKRICLHCGDMFLASDMLGQEYLREQDLCIEVGIIAHSDVADYELDDEAGMVRVREGVNPEATRAISSVTLTRKYDKATGDMVSSEMKITLWSKTDAITLAGKRFRAFPNTFEITDADKVLQRLGIPPGELPPAE